MGKLGVTTRSHLVALAKQPWWVWPAVVVSVITAVFSVFWWIGHDSPPVQAFPLVMTGAMLSMTADDSREAVQPEFVLQKFALAAYAAWLFCGGLVLLLLFLSGIRLP